MHEWETTGQGRHGVIQLFMTAMCACMLLIVASSVSAKDDDFLLSKLSVAGDILSLQPADLDGDSLVDIVIFHRKGLPPDETRWVSIFWQASDGTYGTAADQSWELDKEATIVDVGDVAGDAKLEICYLTSTSVRYYQSAGRLFTHESPELFPCTTLTVFPSKNQIPTADFVRDWDGHPGDEVAVYDFDGLDLYRADSEKQFVVSSVMRIDLRTRLSASSQGKNQQRIAGVRASFRFPDITIGDYNGDGLTDLIATIDDHLQVYPQLPDGSFGGDAAASLTLDIRTQEEKRNHNTELHTMVADLNNDGYADAIVSKTTSKGLSSLRSVINLFWGNPDGYSNIPDQVIISEGSISSEMNMRDVNGDGKLDLIMPSLHLSITAIIRILITKNIPVTFNIFLCQEGKRYSDRPDFQKKVKFKIDFDGESDTQAMTLDGDFNGDGVNDFVLATDDDELSIYLGDQHNTKELFSRKPASKVEADAFGDLIAEDLNNDGYSDMIIHYPNTKGRKGLVEVLVNRGTIR